MVIQEIPVLRGWNAVRPGSGPGRGYDGFGDAPLALAEGLIRLLRGFGPETVRQRHRSGDKISVVVRRERDRKRRNIHLQEKLDQGQQDSQANGFSASGEAKHLYPPFRPGNRSVPKNNSISAVFNG